MRTFYLPVVAVAVLMSQACAIPKVMIAEHYVGDTAKVARHSLRYVKTQSSSDSGQTDLMNYYIQICDVEGNQSTNCETTLVLENVAQYRVR